MSDKKKPDFKVNVKPEQGGGKAGQVFYFYRKEDGKFRGSLDGDIEQLSIKYKGGRVIHLKLKPDSKYCDHYINLFEEEGNAQKFAAPAPSSSADDDIFGSPQTKGTFDGEGDLDGSEIPF